MSEKAAYEVVIECTQIISVIVGECESGTDATNRALLEQAGLVPVYEDTPTVEHLGRTARPSSVRKLDRNDPRHPPRIRN